MSRGPGKPTVRPELSREWFRRYEEEGESPPQIAKAAGYDVRTVRKHLEIERENRERKEARSMVLRQALEQHYADLCTFARRLASEVASGEGTLWALKAYMWAALREHLPRSPIWKNIERWEQVQADLAKLRADIEDALRKLVGAGLLPELDTATPEGETSVDYLLAPLFRARLLTQGNPGSLDETHFRLKQVNRERSDIELEGFPMGRMPIEEVPVFLKRATRLLNEITTMKAYQDMQRHLADREQLVQATQDELVTIALRRIVPGRCRYCPI